MINFGLSSVEAIVAPFDMFALGLCILISCVVVSIHSKPQLQQHHQYRHEDVVVVVVEEKTAPKIVAPTNLLHNPQQQQHHQQQDAVLDLMAASFLANDAENEVDETAALPAAAALTATSSVAIAENASISGVASNGIKRKRDTDEARWSDMYHRLKKYKSENGDCLVPLHYAADKSLGRWVSCKRVTPEYFVWFGKFGWVRCLELTTIPPFFSHHRSQM